jgi:RNA polymerase sporulation-specific sigma factor
MKANDAHYFAKAQAGDQNAQQDLIKANLGLVRHVMKSVGRPEHIETEELLQAGTTGLYHAIMHWRPTGKFSSYAICHIRSAITEAVAAQAMPMTVARKVRQAMGSLEAERDRLRFLLGREPTVDELAEATGYDQGRIERALDAMALNAVDDDVLAINEAVGADHATMVSDHADNTLERVWLNQVMADVDPAMRRALVMHYVEGQDTAKIAKVLGVKPEAVPRLLRRSVVSLRRANEHKPPGRKTTQADLAKRNRAIVRILSKAPKLEAGVVECVKRFTVSESTVRRAWSARTSVTNKWKGRPGIADAVRSLILVIHRTQPHLGHRKVHRLLQENWPWLPHPSCRTVAYVLATKANHHAKRP